MDPPPDFPGTPDPDDDPAVHNPPKRRKANAADVLETVRRAAFMPQGQPGRPAQESANKNKVPSTKAVNVCVDMLPCPMPTNTVMLTL